MAYGIKAPNCDRLIIDPRRPNSGKEKSTYDMYEGKEASSTLHYKLNIGREKYCGMYYFFVSQLYTTSPIMFIPFYLYIVRLM